MSAESKSEALTLRADPRETLLELKCYRQYEDLERMHERIKKTERCDNEVGAPDNRIEWLKAFS
jgi:hypothetical protein